VFWFRERRRRVCVWGSARLFFFVLQRRKRKRTKKYPLKYFFAVVSPLPPHHHFKTPILLSLFKNHMLRQKKKTTDRTMSKREMCAASGDVSSTGRDRNPRTKKRFRPIVVLAAETPTKEEDATDEDEEQKRKIFFEDVICDDLLYVIMSSHCDPHDWKACWGVCRRWRLIAQVAFNPFWSNKPLHYAMLKNPAVLPQLLNHPRFCRAKLGRELVVNGLVMISDPGMRAAWIEKTVQTSDMFIFCVVHMITQRNATVLDQLVRHAATQALEVSAKDAKHALTLALCSGGGGDDDELAVVDASVVVAGVLASVCRMVEARTKSGAEMLRAQGFLDHLMRSKRDDALICLIQHCASVREHAETVGAICTYAVGRSDGRLLRALCCPKKEQGSGGAAVVVMVALSNEHCWDAFMAACIHDWDDIVNALLSRRRVNPGMRQQLCLRLAAANGSEKVVRRLLRDRRCNPGIDNNVMVIVALKNGHVNVATMLLADSRCVLNAVENPVQSVLSRAITLGVKDKKFYGVLASKKFVDPNEHQHSPIRLAVQTENHEALEMLLGFQSLELSDDEKHRVLRTVFNRGDIIERVFKEHHFGSNVWGRCI